MKRLFRMMVGSLMVTGALVGCSSTSDPASGDQDVSISFSAYSYGIQGPVGEGMQQLLDRFAVLHPEITVKAEGVATADVLTKTKAAVAAGSAPDVVQIGYSKLAEAFRTLPVQNLEQIAGGAWAAHVAGLVPGPVQTGRSDGAVRALPFTVSIPTLIYNADLFRAAGLDPADPPSTIEEIRTAATAIHAQGHQGVYFGIVDPAKSDYLTQSVINSAGGSLLGADGAVTFDSSAAATSLGSIQALTKDGLQPAVSVDDATTAFAAGDLGMFVVSTAVLAGLQKAAAGRFELRTAAFPGFDGHPARPTHSGAGLMVLSDDPAKQRAAWTLVQFLTSDEAFTVIAEKMGYLPLRPALVKGALAPYLAEHPLLVPTLDQLGTMQPYESFAGARANQATVILQDDAVAPIVLRGADPAATLAAAAERIRGLTGTS